MQTRKIIFGAAAFLCAAITANADIIMPKIFSDGMVLQEGKPVKIWGKADKGAKVDVEFAGQKKSTAASSEGAWDLDLEPLATSKKPQEMRIFENGADAKKIGDVLIGEVWISGGQSNMYFTVDRCDTFEDAEKSANYPLIRIFSQSQSANAPTPQFDLTGDLKWQSVTPQNVGTFSAAAFYFAESLFKKLDRPIGIVESACGGSAMVAWIKKEDAKGVPDFDKKIAIFEKELSTYNYAAALKKWEALDKANKQKAAELKKEGKPFKGIAPARPNQNSPLPVKATPQMLYNAKIAPLQGYAARGFIWYQGESDSRTEGDGFSQMFARLIQSWRKYWGDDSMPFYFAQLSSYDTSADFPNARAQQHKTLSLAPHTGMAVTFDYGLKENVHPTRKRPVGLRLANLALKEVYGFSDLKPYSPEAASFKYADASAEVALNLKGGAISAKGDLRGFEVLQGDKWTPAFAKIENSVLTVSSANGAKIDGVRYLWKSWAEPDVCLYGQNDLPLLPFLNLSKTN